MIFRPAQISDIPNIQILMNELNQFRNSNFSINNKNFHERKKPHKDLNEKDLEDTILLVCELDNTIVAYIQGSIHERKNHKLNKLGYIDELYVNQKVRGKGLANRLMRELEKTFIEKGCNHITTHTDTENQNAINFYKKNGMNTVTIEFWKKI